MPVIEWIDVDDQTNVEDAGEVEYGGFCPVVCSIPVDADFTVLDDIVAGLGEGSSDDAGECVEIPLEAIDPTGDGGFFTLRNLGDLNSNVPVIDWVSVNGEANVEDAGENNYGSFCPEFSSVPVGSAGSSAGGSFCPEFSSVPADVDWYVCADNAVVKDVSKEVNSDAKDYVLVPSLKTSDSDSIAEEAL